MPIDALWGEVGVDDLILLSFSVNNMAGTAGGGGGVEVAAVGQYLKGAGGT